MICTGSRSPSLSGNAGPSAPRSWPTKTRMEYITAPLVTANGALRLRGCVLAVEVKSISSRVGFELRFICTLRIVPSSSRSCEVGISMGSCSIARSAARRAESRNRSQHARSDAIVHSPTSPRIRMAASSFAATCARKSARLSSTKRLGHFPLRS